MSRCNLEFETIEINEERFHIRDLVVKEYGKDNADSVIPSAQQNEDNNTFTVVEMHRFQLTYCGDQRGISKQQFLASGGFSV